LGKRDRVVLAALAVRPGDVLTADRLADALWGEAVPPSWPKVVQGSVVRLRKRLGHRAIETTPHGYRLAIADDEIDVHCFEALVARGDDLMTRAEPERAVAAYERALGLWRGPPLDDLDRWAPGRGEAARLDEVHRSAEESLVDARLTVKASPRSVADARILVAEGPLRERRWALLARALYGAGRQAEAMDALRTARGLLLDELGMDPTPEMVALERQILTHDGHLRIDAASRVEPSAICPWKGLRSYDADDVGCFFGRETEVSACLRRLRTSPLLVVTGSSGIGKSSLVRAGLIPGLRRAGHSVEVFVPGFDPEARLAAASSRVGGHGVVVVDQLEELFATESPDQDTAGFLDRLAGFALSGGLVVVALRSDHVGDLPRSEAFARLAEQGLHLVSPMSPNDLRMTIKGPAAVAGLSLEPGLVELLMRDVDGEPGALPLLSHVLTATWERREGGTLTVDGYRESGGIREGIAQSAERLFQSLPIEQRNTLTAMLLRLVATTGSGEPVSTRVSTKVLATDADRLQLLEILVQARLVTTDDTTVTVAHEALVREWPRLRSWLDEDAVGQRTFRHLSVAAEGWESLGRPDSELYRGSRLAEALEWAKRSHPDLTSTERSFLTASDDLHRQEERAAFLQSQHQSRQNRRLRFALSATAAVLALALATGLVAGQQWRSATQSGRDARLERILAQSATLRATKPDLAALLALEAYRVRPDASARNALLGSLTTLPSFAGFLRGSEGTAVTDAAFLPDGSAVITAGADGAMRTIDRESGEVLRTFPVPSGEPREAVLAVSPDSRFVAEISWAQDFYPQSRLNIFDVASGKPLIEEQRLSLVAGDLAITADSRYVVATGGHSGRTVVFEAATGRMQGEAGSAPPRDLEPRRTAAVASGVGGTLFVGAEDGVVRALDAATLAELWRTSGAPELTTNYNVAVTPDGSALVSNGPAGVVRWNLQTRKPAWIANVPGELCRSLLVLHTRSAVLCGGDNGRVSGLDLASGEPVGRGFPALAGTVAVLVGTPDETMVAAFSRSDGLGVAVRMDGHGLLTRVVAPGASPVDYSPDGRALLVERGGLPADPELVEVASGRVISPLDNMVHPIWAGDGMRVWTRLPDGSGAIVNATTGQHVVELDGSFGVKPHGHALDRVGHRLLVWLSDNSTRTYNLSTGRLAGLNRTFESEIRELDPFLDGAAFSADGSFVAVSGHGVLTGTATFPTEQIESVASRSDLTHIAAAPDGHLIGVNDQGVVAFYDVRSLEQVGPSFPGKFPRSIQFAFDAAGATVAVTTAESVQLFDVATRQPLGEPIALAMAAPTATSTVAPTATWSATAVKTLPAGRALLRPDGLELAVPATEGVALWDLRVSRWVEAACTLAARNLTREEWDTHVSGLGSYHRTCPAYPAG